MDLEIRQMVVSRDEFFEEDYRPIAGKSLH